MKKMKKLYLDDIRTPKTEGWEIVRSYDEFVEWIETNGVPDEVSLDHDLGEFKKTGYDCAKYLMNYCYHNGLPSPEVNVHSANPVGRENIEAYVNRMQTRIV